MSKAIKITAKKAPKEYDAGASKFFGCPTIPFDWENDFDDDEIFLCQIRLSDIGELDTENRLPHTGYLYVFFHTAEGRYSLYGDIRFYDGEPQLALEDFNATVDEFSQYTDAYLMEFSETDEDEICTRLFGIPSDWGYADEPPKLLMQFDPLDNDMGFLDSIDGFLYFFFGEDDKDLTQITLHEEYS